MTQQIDTKIIDRLKKLLALADATSGATEHEAAAAMAKAQAIMTEHQLTLSQLAANGEETDARREKTEVTKGAAYEYQQQLMVSVAESNFCACWTQKYNWVRTGKGGRYTRTKYVIVGRESNVIATKIMFAYLNDTMERLVPIASNAERLSRSAISWKEGCAARLRDRLRNKRHEMEAKDTQDAAARAAQTSTQPAPSAHTGGTALVLVTLAEAYKEERWANTDHMYGDAPGTAKANYLARKAEADAAEPYVDTRTDAEKAKAEERNRKYWERYDRQQEAKWAKKDMNAYHAGQKAGANIGLDAQVEGGRTKQIAW